MRIKKFVENVLQSKTNKLCKYELGKLTDNEVRKIKNKTNFNINGFNRIVDSYGVKHSFKQHGNQLKENKRGQIAITPEDFENIKNIVKNSDNLENAGKNKIGRNLIKHSKLIENAINVYTEEIRPKNKEIALQTFYKTKKPL